MPTHWLTPENIALLTRRVRVFAMLLAVMFVVMILGWDYPLCRFMERFGQTGFGKAWGEYAHWMGHGGVQLFLGALLIGGGWMYARSKLANVGTNCIFAVIISGLSVQVIKFVLGRARPRVELHADMWVGFTINSDLQSFPSGHTATSFALACWLAIRYPKFSFVFYALATLVALGRVVSGSHFFSDILGGAALGLMVGWIMDFRRRFKERSL